tara:strand:- start:166 stop:399 length:234 start_codon:yes stop_codon:yes gene_type:complete
MIKTSIEKLAKEIGFDIGCSDDVVQADLLNGFCKGIANSMQESNRETQLCYIADKLDNKTNKVLKALVEFIELNEKK